MERILPPERLMEEAKRFAEKVVANGPMAIRAIKRLVDGGIEVAMADALDLEFREYSRVSLYGCGGRHAGLHGKKNAVLSGEMIREHKTLLKEI